MYHIAVCDDDVALCEELARTLEAAGPELPGPYTVDVYYTGEALEDRWKRQGPYDLVILDIEFPSLNGIELGRIIRKELDGEGAQLLYISAKQSYAMELFENRPLHFLVKPLDRDKLLAAVRYAMELSRRRSALFTCTVGKEHFRVPCRDILYFESANKKVTLTTLRGRTTFTGKLSDTARAVPPELFAPIHKSYLVNLEYVSQFTYDSVTMVDGTALPISQPYRRALRERLLQGRRKDGVL